MCCVLAKIIISDFLKSTAKQKKTTDPFVYTVRCDTGAYDIDQRSACFRRFKWIMSEGNIRDHKCFRNFQLSPKATERDVIQYLVYVEGVCKEPDDAGVFFGIHQRDGRPLQIPKKNDLSGVYNKLEECGLVCKFMLKRMRSMERGWRNRINDVKSRGTPHKVLVHMGLLTKTVGLNFGEAALRGGPLGELVQWSDLIAALHLLGHDVTLSWSRGRLDNVISNRLTFNGCVPMRKYDLVFTDVNGLEQIREVLGTLHNYRCVLRVLDIYGTEADFNHPIFNPNKGKTRSWGGRGLQLKQFFTHFPHSPDNSFLGFVVETLEEKHQGNVLPKDASQNKERALLYGKRPEFLRGRKKGEYVEMIRRYFGDIHATMHVKSQKSSDLPFNVTNHGNMDQEEFLSLLRTSRVYVGLESPLEGPAALEAVSQGTVFLNPKFDPPRRLDPSKPTIRKLKSQSPYAEEYIGEPYVYTVDIRNRVEVEKTLKKIKEQPLNEPFVPHEFTYEGFLQRVEKYVGHQDFCGKTIKTSVELGVLWYEEPTVWPPIDLLQVKTSEPHDSCTETCARHQLECENRFFAQINTNETFRASQLLCKHTQTVDPVKESRLPGFIIPSYLPAHDLSRDTCLLQSDSLLFSCASVSPGDVVRVCPCRGS